MEITTLVTRDHINCCDLTAHEFATMMIEDMLQAKRVYDAKWYPIKLQLYRDSLNTQKSILLKNAKRFARRHFRKQMERKEFVETELANFSFHEFKYRSISFFDFDVRPWENGIPHDCILSYDRLTEAAMERCWNAINDNLYFKAAKGWKLVDYHGFRPQITLLLDEVMEALFQQDAKDLAASIEEFYKGCTYYGD